MLQVSSIVHSTFIWATKSMVVNGNSWWLLLPRKYLFGRWDWETQFVNSVSQGKFSDMLKVFNKLLHTLQINEGYRGLSWYWISSYKSILYAYMRFWQEFKEPLYVLEYLERRKPALQVDKLSLRRFSPVDYVDPLQDQVRCPYGNCKFETLSGDAMSAHEQSTKHLGWQRYGERPSERSWVCQEKGCRSSFHQCNSLYNHMQPKLGEALV